MEDQKKFHYEIKAPDRVYWHFMGTTDGEIDEHDQCCWRVNVTQESNKDGIYFEMYTTFAIAPSLIDVFSAFQAKIGTLLRPIAWEIHYHRNTGME